MKESSQIEWFKVTDCLPSPVKEVLVSDDISVSTSMLDSVVVNPDGKGWIPYWRSGEPVAKWAFMPQLPEITQVAGSGDGPSVW